MAMATVLIFSGTNLLTQKTHQLQIECPYGPSEHHQILYGVLWYIPEGNASMINNDVQDNAATIEISDDGGPTLGKVTLFH